MVSRNKQRSRTQQQQQRRNAVADPVVGVVEVQSDVGRQDVQDTMPTVSPGTVTTAESATPAVNTGTTVTRPAQDDLPESPDTNVESLRTLALARETKESVDTVATPQEPEGQHYTDLMIDTDNVEEAGPGYVSAKRHSSTGKKGISPRVSSPCQ